MADNLISTNDYKKLLEEARQILAEGKQRAVSAVNQIALETYWHLGQRISKTVDALSAADAAAYFNQLAVDLELDKTLVYRISQFYKMWPDKIPAVDGVFLSWSHHVELLSVKNEEERIFYLETASKEDWGRSTLRKAIQKDYFEAVQKDPDSNVVAQIKRDPSPLYVYKAVVENVVDGDTLLTRIDLGFAVWVEQRIRFRGINTAELTHNGVPIANAEERAVKAKEFVADKLKDIPFVVIKTYKTDMYGRFVADVFYHPTLTKKEDVATKGFFLNEQLLQAGLADVML